MSKAKKLIPGVCRYCKCTDQHACAGGCSWWDTQHTVCTTNRCVRKAVADGLKPANHFLTSVLLSMRRKTDNASYLSKMQK